MSVSRGSRRTSEAYRETLRDAFLLRGLWSAVEADGRSAMAQFNDRGDDGPDARRAVPGRYALPEDWRTEPGSTDAGGCVTSRVGRRRRR